MFERATADDNDNDNIGVDEKGAALIMTELEVETSSPPK